jgi:hypothetical protein
MSAQQPPLSKMPRLVIIESTALFQLGSLFEHVEFADLRYLRKLLKFEIVVSSVSWMEFLRKRNGQVSECIARMRQLRSSIEKLGQSPDELKAVEDRVSDLQKNLASVFEKKLASLEIRILPLAKADLESLLNMSIENVPPFEESHEKGFRDSLIMFSVLEAIAGRPELNALLVCEDKLLREGILAKQGDYGTVVDVVADIGKANAHILGLLSEFDRARRSKEKQAAKDLLLKSRPEIEKAVEGVREFSYFDIPSSPLGFGAVERILSFKFNDVNSATWKVRTEESATILFSLKCTLTALVHPPLLEFLNTRYQVGGGTMLTPTNRDPKEIKIEKIVYGVAEFVKKDGELKLVLLQIDQSLPTEDLAELIATE